MLCRRRWKTGGFIFDDDRVHDVNMMSGNVVEKNKKYQCPILRTQPCMKVSRQCSKWNRPSVIVLVIPIWSFSMYRTSLPLSECWLFVKLRLVHCFITTYEEETELRNKCFELSCNYTGLFEKLVFLCTCRRSLWIFGDPPFPGSRRGASTDCRFLTILCCW